MKTVGTPNQTGPALGFESLAQFYCQRRGISLSYDGKMYARALTIVYKFSRSDRSPPMTCAPNLQRRRIQITEGGGTEGRWPPPVLTWTPEFCVYALSSTVTSIWKTVTTAT